ncbi:uncharacterized protein [Anabrus simplex]|uniref:uncharacterized protein isoform X2 n=1 Tax=Anabrus simplex TaxID=316456 RepID=UPI0035A33A3D
MLYFLVAASREHILLANNERVALPRVLHKLSLCVNPCRMIQPLSTEMTGLYNELLEKEQPFNANLCDMLKGFLERLTPPICMVAHNGMKFDFPILLAELNKCGKMLSDEILCADSYLGFRELLMKQPGIQNKQSSTVARPSLNHGTENIASKNQDESKLLICDDILDSVDGADFLEKFSLELIAPNMTQKKTEDKDFVKSSAENKNDPVVVTLDSKEEGQWHMRKLNETTPERSKNSLNSIQGFHKKAERNQIHDNKCARKRLFPSEYKEDSPAPKSLKLVDVYQFLLKKSMNGSHHAECDVLHLLECVVALSSDFIHWTDENAVKLSNIKKIW